VVKPESKVHRGETINDDRRAPPRAQGGTHEVARLREQLEAMERAIAEAGRGASVEVSFTWSVRGAPGGDAE
jgi:hypothetical protein